MRERRAKRQQPNRPLQELDAQALIARIRSGDRAACHEYMSRYSFLLEEMASRYGADPAEREDIVYEVLHDMLLRIQAHRVSEQTSLGPYLVSALKHRLSNQRRDDEVKDRAQQAATEDCEGEGESAVRSTCSEYAWRASRPPDCDDETGLHPAVARLHAFVKSLLTTEQLDIAGWVGDGVGQREIAEWLGAAYGATRMRVSRMRESSSVAAQRYVEGLPPEERAVIERYLSGSRRMPVRGGADADGEDAGDTNAGDSGDE